MRKTSGSTVWPLSMLNGRSWTVELFESLAPDIGAEGRGFMKRKTKYKDEPLGRIEIVSDFLPPPERLVLRDDGVKVTIALSKRSVEFFKRHAARSKVPYQKMIRSLLDGYVKHHETDL
jgi:hypothetical protein